MQRGVALDVAVVGVGNMGALSRAPLGAVEQSSGQSWIGSDRMTLLEKDTRLAVQAARAAGFTGPLGAVVRDAFAQASAALLRWLEGDKA